MDRGKFEIDFPRYLSIWLFSLHMPEADFWRTMNPRRLHALFDSWFGITTKPARPEPPQQKKKSLSEYLMNGG